MTILSRVVSSPFQVFVNCHACSFENEAMENGTLQVCKGDAHNFDLLVHRHGRIS